MFGRARETSTAAWRAMAVTAAVSAVLIVGGSLLSALYRPGTRPLDAIAYVLLAAGAVSVGLALVWPVVALILALAATSVFYSLGYSHVSQGTTGDQDRSHVRVLRERVAAAPDGTAVRRRQSASLSVD